jgi:hypothetical protein
MTKHPHGIGVVASNALGIHRPAIVHRRIKSANLKLGSKLPAAAKAVIHAMVHGPHHDVEVKFDGPAAVSPKVFKAYEAMTFIDACRMFGFDPAKVLGYARLKRFRDEMDSQLETRRCLERARNLSIAIAIRDDEDTNDAIKMKAMWAIEQGFRTGFQPKAAVQINNIQNSGNGATKPGYVLRFPERGPKTIEHEK